MGENKEAHTHTHTHARTQTHTRMYAQRTWDISRPHQHHVVKPQDNPFKIIIPQRYRSSRHFLLFKPRYIQLKSQIKETNEDNADNSVYSN